MSENPTEYLKTKKLSSEWKDYDTLWTKWFTAEDIKRIALARIAVRWEEAVTIRQDQEWAMKIVAMMNPFDKDIPKENWSNSKNLPESPEEYDLKNGIPDKAKKFWVTPDNITLLDTYWLKAVFIPEWQYGWSWSNDRIEIVKKNGERISYEDINLTRRSSDSISLTSDKNNEPTFKNVSISDGITDGKKVLRIKFWTFNLWINEPNNN